MAMNPRTHPRGAPPDFNMDGLPPNPKPARITKQMWWLRCMRLRLEPLSDDGGILAIKDGFHSYGSRLPDYGPGDSRTDHSIRRAPDRSGPWWEDFAAAHDWTFTRAHTGNYTEIKKYTRRLRDSMRSLTDLRPDDVYAYTIGQIDDDRQVEGWNEYTDDDESGDDSHLWHRHDSFRRNIVGSFPHMWKALTIDMGWTYAEWQRSVAQQEDDMPTAAEIAKAVWEHKLTDPASTKTPKATKPAGDYVRYNDVVNAVSANAAAAPLLAAVHALAQRADVDEAALVAALAPAVAAAVLAQLPQGADQISQEEVNIAVERAFHAAFAG